METREAFDGEDFVRLLESGEMGLFSPSSKMLCFSSDGGFDQDEMGFGVSQKPSVSGSCDTSSASSTSNNSCGFVNNKSILVKKKGSQSNTKKPKTETPNAHVSNASGGKLKVKKEKMGERIMALQQLVSPFGKTDTASVLHEAMGYIRFLHDQVQVLSSPYLQRLPSTAPLDNGGGEKCDLRSRGLCLVPVSYTVHVAESNGADFWSPAMCSDSNITNVKR